MWWQVSLHSSSQLVLILQTPNLGRPLDHSTAGNHLVWCELLTGEVHLNPVPQAVPPVVVHPPPIEDDFADHQVSIKQVADNQGGHAALPASQIGRTPLSPASGAHVSRHHESLTAWTTSPRGGMRWPENVRSPVDSSAPVIALARAAHIERVTQMTPQPTAAIAAPVPLPAPRRGVRPGERAACGREWWVR